MIYVVRHRETVASLVASTGFTSTYIPPTDNKVIYAVIQALGGDVRFCVDGSTPTTALGQRIVEDGAIEVWGENSLTNFRAINDGGTATLEVVYMGVGG